MLTIKEIKFKLVAEIQLLLVINSVIMEIKKAARLVKKIQDINAPQK